MNHKKGENIENYKVIRHFNINYDMGENKTMVQVFKNGEAGPEDLPLLILLVCVSRVVFNAMVRSR